MITCDSVDLPEPFGPITAWTSPLRTVRSMPRRISRALHRARRPSIDELAHGSTTQHVVAVDRATSYTGTALVAGQRLRLAGLERERAAVLPALDLALVGVDLALGQRDVLVGAGVADGVEVVADADHGDA